jgi:hypothetical protein
MAYVYRHIRIDKNQPFYIGIGAGEKYVRANDYLRRGKLWKRIAAFGYEVEILFDDVDLEFAKKKEIEFISLYGRINDGGCLANISGGGDGYFNPTVEFRQRLADRNRANKFNLGKKHTDDAKRKMGESSKGRHAGDKNPSYKGRIVAYKGGVFVGEYLSTTECVRELSIWGGGVSACLNGNRKSAGGYTFKRIPK